MIGGKLKTRRSFATRSELVALPSLRKMFELSRTVANPLHFEVGEPPFRPPKHVLDAAIKGFYEDYGSPHLGFLELRKAIAEKLKRDNGLDTDPECELLISCGSQASLYAIFTSLIEQGDEVIIPEPSYYPMYKAMIKLSGGIPKPVPMIREEGFRLDPEAVRKAVTRRTRMIVLNTPVNPTGAVFDLNELRRIAEVALENALYVVADEAYEKLVYDGSKHYSIASLPEMKNLALTVQTFSKTYSMTGFRIGYVAAGSDVIEQVGKVHYYMNIYASPISQRAALAALTGPQDYVAEIVKEYHARRRLLVEGLNEVEGFKCLAPEGTFYSFPDISSFGRSEEFAVRLLKATGIVTAYGSGFGPHGEGHLRMSFANTREDIEECIRRLKTDAPSQDIRKRMTRPKTY